MVRIDPELIEHVKDVGGHVSLADPSKQLQLIVSWNPELGGLIGIVYRLEEEMWLTLPSLEERLSEPCLEPDRLGEVHMYHRITRRGNVGVEGKSQFLFQGKAPGKDPCCDGFVPGKECAQVEMDIESLKPSHFGYRPIHIGLSEVMTKDTFETFRIIVTTPKHCGELCDSYLFTNKQGAMLKVTVVNGVVTAKLTHSGTLFKLSKCKSGKYQWAAMKEQKLKTVERKNTLQKLAKSASNMVYTSCYYDTSYCSTSDNIAKTEIPNVSSLTEGTELCSKSCHADASCYYFTFFFIRQTGFCYLMDQCDDQLTGTCLTRGTCRAGPKFCSPGLKKNTPNEAGPGKAKTSSLAKARVAPKKKSYSKPAPASIDYKSLMAPSCYYERSFCDIQGHISKTRVGKPGQALQAVNKLCQEKCNSDPSCSFFTLFYIREEGYCYVLSHCTPKKSRCLKRDTCTSGSKNCKVPESGLPDTSHQNDQPQISEELLLRNLDREEADLSGIKTTVKAKTIPYVPVAKSFNIDYMVSEREMDSECLSEKFYCDIKTHISETEIGVVGGHNLPKIEACYTLCNSNSTCNYFTFFSIRERGFCYLLETCKYRVDGACVQNDKCKSGFSNCHPTKSACPSISTLQPQGVDWMCFDPLTEQIPENVATDADEMLDGTICLAKCPPQNRRTSNFLQYECRKDGTWARSVTQNCLA